MHLVGYTCLQFNRLLRFQDYLAGQNKEANPLAEKYRCPIVSTQPSTLQLGDTHAARKEYAQAIEFYTQALAEISKNHVEQSKAQTEAVNALNSRALCYFHIHKYQKALTDLNYVISLDPRCRSAYNTRASIFVAMNNQHAAALDLMRLYEIDSVTTTALADSSKTDETCTQPASNLRGAQVNPQLALVHTCAVVFCVSFALMCISMSILR